MLFELNIISSGENNQSDEVAEVMKALNGSGFEYLVTPSGACIEGGWEEVMALIAKCHDREREPASHVITGVKIENEKCGRNKLTLNVRSVEADGDLKFAHMAR